VVPEDDEHAPRGIVAPASTSAAATARPHRLPDRIAQERMHVS
jgi:hypothetical protein